MTEYHKRKKIEKPKETKNETSSSFYGPKSTWEETKYISPEMLRRQNLSTQKNIGTNKQECEEMKISSFDKIMSSCESSFSKLTCNYNRDDKEEIRRLYNDVLLAEKSFYDLKDYITKRGSYLGDVLHGSTLEADLSSTEKSLLSVYNSPNSGRVYLWVGIPGMLIGMLTGSCTNAMCSAFHMDGSSVSIGFGALGFIGGCIGGGIAYSLFRTDYNNISRTKLSRIKDHYTPFLNDVRKKLG